MTEASEGQRAVGTTTADSLPTADSGVTSPPGPSHALLGPFTLREVVFGGGVALVFIGTLLPFLDGMVRYATFWNSQPLFFIGIGILVPVIALALLAGRRLGSHGLRVGSLSVDQFASVSAVLAVTFFFLQTVTAFDAGPLLALIGSLGMLAATVVGPFLPVIRDDFADRPEVPAHPAARPMTAARPRPARPAKAEASEATGTTPGVTAVTSGPTPAGSGSSSAGRSAGDINPAAAAARQNGAGLYGAGGAGAVGAGAAASGQSGIERSASQEPAREDSVSRAAGDAADTPDAPDTSDTSAGTGAHTVGQSGRPGHDSDDHAEPHGASVTDRPSDRTQPTPAERTRVHETAEDGPVATEAAAGGVREERTRQEPITATRSAGEEPVVEAFWFAVGSSRPVFDERTGHEIFTLQPGDWEVGIEDRDHEFLVQDKRTGAVGILRDLHNIERAPRD